MQGLEGGRKRGGEWSTHVQHWAYWQTVRLVMVTRVRNTVYLNAECKACATTNVHEHTSAITLDPWLCTLALSMIR